MRFNKFMKMILEMSLSQALEVFGMQDTELGNPAFLKKKFRDLSKTNHPDHGGDLEVMKSINVAYALLKTSKAAQSTSRINWDDIHKKYRALGSQIKASLMAGFKPEIFIQYFNTFTSDKFEFEYTRIFPKETETSPSYAGFHGEFFTSNRDTVFDFEVMVHLTDIADNTGLGYENYQYPLFITAYGFHNSKKQKLSSRDYKFSNDHAFFNDPSKAYPSAKLKKIFSGATSKRQFKKRDFQMFMAKKCKASIDSDWCRIPIVDDYKLTLYRNVFMKVAHWGVNGVYKKFGRIGRVEYVTLPETEETAKMLFDLQKQCAKGPVNDEAVIKRISNFLKAYNKKTADKVNVYA